MVVSFSLKSSNINFLNFDVKKVVDNSTIYVFFCNQKYFLFVNPTTEWDEMRCDTHFLQV